MSDVTFSKIHVGNMSEIPPDFQAGTYRFECNVSKRVQDDAPVLVFTWKILEDMTGDNDAEVGKSTSEWLKFVPETHKDCRRFRLRLNELCAAFDIDLPDMTELSSFDDLEPFISSLDGATAVGKAINAKSKDGSRFFTNIRFAAAQPDEEPAPLKSTKKKKAS